MLSIMTHQRTSKIKNLGGADQDVPPTVPGGQEGLPDAITTLLRWTEGRSGEPLVVGLAEVAVGVSSRQSTREAGPAPHCGTA